MAMRIKNLFFLDRCHYVNEQLKHFTFFHILTMENHVNAGKNDDYL